MNARCIWQLCDPDRLSPADAIRFARQVSGSDPGFAPGLRAWLLRLNESPETDVRTVRRGLELLYAVSGPARFARISEEILSNGGAVTRALLRWLIVSTPRRVRRIA